jgi:hypothetical protein
VIVLISAAIGNKDAPNGIVNAARAADAQLVDAWNTEGAKP